MYKTCIDWLINSTHLHICWVSPGRPSSVQCPGFTKLEHDLDIQFFNPERLHAWTSEIINSPAWTIFCTAVQTRKNSGNFCVLDADAERSERVELATWWAGPLPVLLLTSDHHQSMPGYKTKYWKFAEIKRWGFTNFERFGRVLRLQ